MVSVFARFVLGSVAAAMAAGVATAQVDKDFAEGVQLLRLGKREEALAKLSEVLRQDPSHADAFQIWRQTDTAIWQWLVQEGGEFEKLARHLVGLATTARKELSRETEKIEALVDDATSNPAYDARRKATLELISNHGEFAIPALIDELGNADSHQEQNYAILLAHSIGRPAVLPLIQLLGHESATVRRNAAAALRHIGDHRAAPAIAKLALHDSDEVVREVAAKVLVGLGVPAGRNPVDLHVDQAKHYLLHGIPDVDRSEVVWTLQDGALVAVDTPSLLQPFELAKDSAIAALMLDPASAEAKALVARAHLAEAVVVADSLATQPDHPQLAPYAARAEQWKMIAMASGTAALRKVMADSIADGQIPVAVAAIRALGKAEARDALAGSPLVEQLDAEDRRIRYAAALALAEAAGSSNPPAADRIVRNLGGAVTEEALRVIKVIDASPDARKVALEAAAKQRGNFVDASASIARAAEDLMTFPNVDVVVINENVPDGLPETLIGFIRKDPRLQHVKVLVIAAEPEKATERFGETIHGTIQGPLSGEALVGAVNQALEGTTMDSRRARADAVAVAASEALQDLAAQKIDVAPALENLAAQLNRSDSVAVPAARALGSGGTANELPALLGAIGSESASLDLKVASAEAIGKILARLDSVPGDAFNGLLELLGSGADLKLKSAIVTALGKGKLAPGESLKLIDVLRRLRLEGPSEG
jgi:HEAT repeat protein